MKNRRIFLSLAVLFLGYAPRAEAQWHKVAPHAVSAFLPRIPGFWQGSLLGLGGAITYKDGIVWAGYNEISYSLDSGKSWKQTSLQDRPILDISFLNRDTGVVMTDSIVYLTHDRGKTWTPSPSFPISPQIYFFTDSLIFLNTANGTVIPYSTDGGTSWKTLWWGSVLSPGALNGNGFVISKRGTVLLLLAANGASYYPISLAYTRDMGNTWYQFRGPQAQIGADTYSLDLDSCYGSTLYAVQENYYSTATGDPQSDIYLTTDGGSTWTINFSHAPLYLSGSFTSSKHAEYAATVADGILRSTDHGQSWKNIGGPTNKPDSRCIYAVNDNLVFALDSLGNFWSTPNSGGDSVTAPGDSFTLSTDSLFFHDTISCGKTITKTVYFSHPPPCSPTVSSSFLGNGASGWADYGEQGTPDSVTFAFHRFLPGTGHASMVFQLSDGSLDTIFLQGTSLGGDPLSVTPDTLFANDTLTCASPVTRTLQFHYLNCGSPVVVQSVSVGGPNASNYQFHNLNHDSVTVEFDPAKTGLSRGYFFIQRDDGKTDTVLLRGYSTVKPFQYSASRTALFTSDTLALCDATALDTIAFQFSGCEPSILSQQIIGTSASDYSPMRLLASPLTTFDTIILSFKPSASGDRTAELDVAFDNGTTLRFPLSGVAMESQSLSILTSDVKADTLGGEIAVPIRILGLPKVEDLNLSMQYTGTIKYIGSRSQDGEILDIPGTALPGYSRLHVTQAIPDSVAGFAYFTIFKDSLPAESVTFDSLELSGSDVPCSYMISQTPAIANILISSSCDIPILSRYLHLGTLPHLSLTPNPTTGNLSITADKAMGPVTISAIDELGTVEFETQTELSANDPFHLNLPSGSGIYEIRINSLPGLIRSRIVVIR